MHTHIDSFKTFLSTLDSLYCLLLTNSLALISVGFDEPHIQCPYYSHRTFMKVINFKIDIYDIAGRYTLSKKCRLESEKSNEKEGKKRGKKVKHMNWFAYLCDFN